MTSLIIYSYVAIGFNSSYCILHVIARGLSSLLDSLDTNIDMHTPLDLFLSLTSDALNHRYKYIFETIIEIQTKQTTKLEATTFSDNQ